MEFNEKLQELRKQNGLTQEELAASLYVSRAAISKWESGRGYPNIDSLKAIASYFSVTVDELLSDAELRTLAAEDYQQKRPHFFDLIFGLLDSSIAILLFLPFFREKSEETISEVSLLTMTEIQPYLKTAYFIVVFGMIVTGLLMLSLQNCHQAIWLQNKYKLSCIINTICVLLFVISLQPYPAIFMFILLAIKVFLLRKNTDTKGSVGATL